MKTITFYSYKGGVGRSLALSNIARRLSELKKKVCIIDFDLDAPGLQFKFQDNYRFKQIKKGLLDYIYDFSNSGHIPEGLTDYVTTLWPNNQNHSLIQLIAAGNILDNEYWKKLSMISWSDLFYSENAQGIPFFLDLKHKIETEIQPDFLLIDSRTGITDISGITLRLFADEAVVLAVNNEENIFGSKMIIKNLLDEKSALFGKLPKIHFVVTRVPFTDTPQDKLKTLKMMADLKLSFQSYLNTDKFDINLIHSDRRLEERERYLIGYELDESTASISNDYLRLFKLLTSDLLTEQELVKLDLTRKAEQEYKRGLETEDMEEKLAHAQKAVQLAPDVPRYLLLRGYTYAELRNFEAALEDHLKFLAMVENNESLSRIGYANLAKIYADMDLWDKALEVAEQQIKLFPDARSIDFYRTKISALNLRGDEKGHLETLNIILDELKIADPQILNSRADYYRSTGRLQEAYKDIYRALEIDPDDPTFIATLGEIEEANGNNEAFYMHFSNALRKGLKPDMIQSAKDVYLKYEKDERIIDLLAQYNMDFDVIKDL